MNSTSLVSDIIAWLEWQKYCGLEYLDEYTYDSILSFCEYYIQNVDEIEAELERIERLEREMQYPPRQDVETTNNSLYLHIEKIRKSLPDLDPLVRNNVEAFLDIWDDF